MTIVEQPGTPRSRVRTVWVDRPECRERGLAAAHAAKRAGAERRRRTGGAETGYYARPDWRLDPWQASAIAGRLERAGWRAESVLLGQGIALVEVRSLKVRWTPLVAVLRAPDDLAGFLASHAEHGEGGTR